MTKVLFATKRLAAVVAQAARIAPSKGAAFDKADGILIELDPMGDPPCSIRATDLELSYRAAIQPLRLEGDSVAWRINASTFAKIIAGLPAGDGDQVRFEDREGSIHYKAGRKVGKLRYRDGDGFPDFVPFDPAGMAVVPNFGKRLNQVAWGVGENAPLAGVHLDGKYLIGCDSVVGAVVECPVPLAAPVTAPLAPLQSLLKDIPEVHIRGTQHSLQIMPDASTQVTSVLYEQSYPNVHAVFEMNEPEAYFRVNRQELADAIAGCAVVVNQERYPRCRLTVRPGELHIYVKGDEGIQEDDLDIQGGTGDHEIDFTPINLIQALNATSASEVTIGYRFDKMMSGAPRPSIITDDDTYRCLLMPRAS